MKNDFSCQEADAERLKLLKEHVDSGPQSTAADESLCRSLIELAVDAIFVGDPQGNIIYANQRAVVLTGYPLEELNGKNLAALFSEAERTRVPLRYDLLKAGRIVQNERMMTCKDGSLVAIEMRSRMMPDGSYHTFVRDLTERKQIEESLGTSEQKFSTIFRMSPDAISINRLEDGVLLEVNEGFAALSGYRPEEVLGRTPLELGFWMSHEERDFFLRALARKGSLVNFEAQFQKRDGSILMALISSSIIEIEGEKCILTIFRDNTERRQQEKQRSDLISQLQDKTAQLERFIYTVSHDLKSPLVTISGFLGIVEQDYLCGDDVRFRSDLAVIAKAAKRMQQLLDGLLELSRIDAKKRAVELVKLGDLIGEATENVSGQLSAHNAVVEVAADLPEVSVDKQSFLQVFENLIVNAARYSYPVQGGSLVQIGVRRNAGQWICYVKDNGCGIEPEYLEIIFGLFERLDPKSEGSGVGLAIVKRIVEGHGGKVWAESDGPGCGASFCFTLPGGADTMT